MIKISEGGIFLNIATVVGMLGAVAVMFFILSANNLNPILGTTASPTPQPQQGLQLESEKNFELSPELKGLITPTPKPKGYKLDPDVEATPTPSANIFTDEEVNLILPKKLPTELKLQ